MGRMDLSITHCKGASDMTDKVKAHTLAKGKPYSQLVARRDHFAAWVIAAAAVSGMVRTNKASVTSTKKPGNQKLFKAIVGKTAYGTWTKSRISDKGITAEGLNEMNTRLAGGNRYATTMDVVKAMTAAMRKGGTLELDGRKYKLLVDIK